MSDDTKKIDLAGLIESLASEIVMTDDPTNLISVQKLLDFFNRILEISEAENMYAPSFKAVAERAIDIAEEMIVQDKETGAKSLQELNRIVSGLQESINSEADPMSVLKLESESKDAPAAVPGTVVDELMLRDYLDRQDGVLEEIEALVLDLENKKNTSSALADLKRVFHTVKGEAGMLSLPGIEKVCHEVENLFDNGINEKLADKLLEAKDWLSDSFKKIADNYEVVLKTDAIISKIKGQGEDKPEVEPVKIAEPAVEPVVEEARVLNLDESDSGLFADFIEEARGHLDDVDIHLLELESDPENAESLNAVFRCFHTIKGAAGFLNLDDVQGLSHVAEDLLDKARKGSMHLSGSAIDVIFESVDVLRKLMKLVEKAVNSDGALQRDSSIDSLITRIKDVLAGRAVDNPPAQVPPNSRLGDILVSKGSTDKETVERVISSKDSGKKLGEALVKDGGVPAREVASAIRAQNSSRQQPDKIKMTETIKISTDRLDKMLEIIGELVITESMVSQDDEFLMNASDRLVRNVAQLNKITREMQEIGMSMRMVQVKPVFQKMARLVRDLAKSAGKRVEFVTRGEDTELDRSVVEQIGDPLIHLVRNSVDHGIEDSEAERIKAGKNPVSTVELCAYHKSGNIVLEVTDDGKGLDREKILDKAREKGIVSDGSEMSDREVFGLIMAPGFSTAKKVTNISGRGVGMDVVKRNIEGLRGNIELISEKGRGTTIRMRLPLSLAIIDGLTIEVGNEQYIVPTLSVVESFRPELKDIYSIPGCGEVMRMRGEVVQMYRLANVFNIGNAIADPSKSIVIIVDDQSKRFAIMVDSLIGQKQVVIKSLGKVLGKVPGISGGAIMSDGSVGLILDIAEFIKLARSKYKSEGNRGELSGKIKEEILSDAELSDTENSEFAEEVNV